MKKSNFFILLFIFIIIGFFVGVITLFNLRFEKGDIYPPYSTLRADPLGTMALYESIAAADGVEAIRNFSPVSDLLSENGVTIFYPGVNFVSMTSMENKWPSLIEEIVQRGNRFVFSFYPVSQKPKKNMCEKDKKDNKTDKSFLEPKNEEFLKVYCSDKILLNVRWGFTYGFTKKGHSKLYFDKLEEGWKVISSHDGHARIIEKKVGDGTIVLTADSFFLSNEALLKKRDTKILTWLMGSNKNIIFDETHLGVSKNQHVATLIKKYDISALFLGFLFVGGLYILKSATSFLPPYVNDAADMSYKGQGKDSLFGLITMLRYNISVEKLLPVCVEEFIKTSTHRKLSQKLIEQIQKMVSQSVKPENKKQYNLDCYRKISALLQRQGGKFKQRGGLG